jgi:hypothetical protein
MPSRELTAPGAAAYRLALEQNIPDFIAMQIVGDALMDEKCYVRQRFGGSMRDVRKGLAEALIAAMDLSHYKPPFLVLPRDFEFVELDWHDLLEHWRKFLPPEFEYLVPAEAHAAKHEPATPRKTTKTEAVRAYINEKYPDGIPAGIPDKTIAHECGVSKSTVRRVLGRK